MVCVTFLQVFNHFNVEIYLSYDRVRCIFVDQENRTVSRIPSELLNAPIVASTRLFVDIGILARSFAGVFCVL